MGKIFNLVNMMLSCEFYADSLIRDLCISYSAPAANGACEQCDNGIECNFIASNFDFAYYILLKII